MASPVDRQETAKRLADWNWRGDQGLILLRDVAKQGPDGIELLMEERSRRSEPYERQCFVQAIAESKNPDAVDTLRQVAHSTGPGSTESRSIAIYGLALLLGPNATEDLKAALGDKHRGNRWLAVIRLAEVGTSAAWERAFEELQRVLSRPSKRSHTPPEAASYVCYLGRYAYESNNRTALIGLLRKYWTRLPDPDRMVLDWVWPGVGPDGPAPDALAPPDAERLTIGIDVEAYTWGPLQGVT